MPRGLLAGRRAAVARRDALEWLPSALERRQCGGLAARIAPTPVPDAPAVVLLHGLAASGTMWGRAWDALSQRGPLVIPDLLGFGHSPRPRAGYTLDDHADAVAACLDAAGIDGPAILVGHSFGGLVALTIARRDPRRAAALVLVSTPLFRSGDVAYRQMIGSFDRVERVIATINPISHTLCRGICMGRPRLARRLAVLLRPELPLAVAREGVLHSWGSYSQSFVELVGARARPEWVAEVGRPVRILAGGRDRCLDLEVLAEAAAAAPLAELRVEATRGHLLPMEDPAVCMGVVEELRAAVARAPANPPASAHARDRLHLEGAAEAVG